MTPATDFSLADAARAARAELVSAPACPDWTAQAQIFSAGAVTNHDYAVHGEVISGALFENCSLIHGHYIATGDGLVFRRLHHNSETTVVRYVDPETGLKKKISKLIAQAEKDAVTPGRFFLINGTCHNLWHFMFNYASRLTLLNSIEESDYHFLVSKDIKKDFLELLHHLGVPPDRVRLIDPTRVERFEKLFVSECPVSLFEGRLLAHRTIETLWTGRRAAPASEGPRKIFVSRRDAAWRRLLNEDKVEDLLESRGFTSVQLTDMTMTEMMSLFADVDIVVSPSGANLAAAMFCRKGASVIELTYDPFTSKYYFQLGSSLRDCRHLKVRGVAHPDDHGYERWDFNTSLEDLENALESAHADQ